MVSLMAVDIDNTQNIVSGYEKLNYVIVSPDKGIQTTWWFCLDYFMTHTLYI